ncbi:hypothetical protein [Bacillus marasmi]|uniref:hypothetical protein n=1 Tax=Bacillus marasmi TaxID=1926279 RepID=UPI0011C8A20B|nr:hypothetical protein [Bacillus marasmi]
MLRKIILMTLLAVNSFYYVFYIFNFGSAALINWFWTVAFFLGIILSSYFLYQYVKQSVSPHLLSLAVLIISVTSLGAFYFRQLLDGIL